MSAGEITLLGEMGSVQAVAHRLSQLDGMQRAMSLLSQGVSQVRASGDAKALTKLVAACAPVESRAQQIASIRLDAGQAFADYSSQVSALQEHARRTFTQLEACQWQRASLGGQFARLDPDAPGCDLSSRALQARLADTDAEMAALRSRLRTLDEERRGVNARCAARVNECAAALNALTPSDNAAGAPVATASLAALVRPTKVDAADIATRRDHPLLAGLTATVLRQSTPEEVAMWWAALTDEERATLIAEVPLRIGNLNGVPFAVRIQANALTAAEFAKMPGISANEKSYWEAVAGGTRMLISSDPEYDRLIEMIGEIGPNTQRTVTYAPGTAADMNGFFAGHTQQVAKFLVDESRGGTVAFVYKDGPWVEWTGEHHTLSRSFSRKLGQQLAEFQTDLIANEPYLGSVQHDGVGHSAAMGVFSSAEVAGAEFDVMASFGGSWLDEKWEKNPDTEYHHFQYSYDAVRALERVSPWHRTPASSDSGFEQHYFESDESGVINHNKIVQGPDTNREVLDELKAIIER